MRCRSCPGGRGDLENEVNHKQCAVVAVVVLGVCGCRLWVVDVFVVVVRVVHAAGSLWLTGLLLWSLCSVS